MRFLSAISVDGTIKDVLGTGPSGRTITVESSGWAIQRDEQKVTMDTNGTTNYTFIFFV